MKITSDKSLWIENYKNLLQYDNNEIILRTREGVVCVLGESLLIDYFSEEDMLISGKISCIRLNNHGEVGL